MKFFTYAVFLFSILTVFSCQNGQTKQEPNQTNDPLQAVDMQLSFTYTADSAGTFIRQWLDSTTLSVDFPKIDEAKMASDLFDFYKARNFSPAWGVGTSRALVDAIGQLGSEGLSPDAFPEARLRSLLDSAKSVDASAETGARLDLLLSATYLKLADVLATGKIKASKISDSWHLKKPSPDTLASHLKIAVAGSVESSLDSFRPGFGQYAKLRRHLAQYRRLVANGGWTEVEKGGDLTPGDSSARITSVRKRLHLTGDLELSPDHWQQPARYDSTLVAAVNRYQRRNGLVVQDEINDKMVAAMNVPAETRLKQIMLNLDRLRWLSSGPMPRAYVLVNVPEYRLHVVEDGREIKQMNVVVGKVVNATPFFSDTIEYVQFSPYWNVPNSIASRELWPKIRASASYVDRNHFEILDGWGGNANVVSRSRVNWGNLGTYRIRQKPGPWNALGQVKFMFPNQYAIYLHDTPSDHLFDKNYRAFSHGCIRIAEPAWFADWLLPQYDRETVTEKMNDRNWERVNLNKKIPVYIIYLTSFEDGGGRLNFRPDLYDLDQKMTAEFDSNI